MPNRSRTRPALCATAVCLSVLWLAGCVRDGRPDLTPAAKVDEPVVAHINGAPILARQLDAMVQADRVRRLADAEPPSAERELEMRREALNLLISGELLYQAAIASGLSVSESEIDRLVAARPQFASDEAYLQHLEEAGLSREGIRRRIERRELMKAYAKRVTGGLEIDESVAERIYEEQKDRFWTEEQVRASYIVARVAADASAASRREVRERMEEIRRRAIDGEDFTRLVEQQPDPFLYAVHPDTGLVGRARVPDELAPAVFETPVGQITPVIETSQGFHLCKVLEKTGSVQRDFEEVKTALLMLLARDQQDLALRSHVAELRERAEVVIHDPELD